jgi:hypothetical protein
MAIHESTNDIGIAQDAATRAPRTRVRSWTGRAAMSLSTDSHVSTLVTAGTRRTRVSEMRLPGRTGSARSAHARPVPPSLARRCAWAPPRPDGRSG